MVDASGTWRGRAFGLDVETPFRLPWLGRSNGRPSNRTTRIELVSIRDIESRWPAQEATRVVDRKYADGRPMLRIDRHEAIGYRVWWPGNGRHLVSLDGKKIRSVLPEVSPWRWHKFLFTVVLPLAAKLRGLEVFHASAVSLGEGAIAFVAPSGVGKSSIAAHLVAGGADFVSDDVIALEASDGGVLVHPAAGMASVADEELRQMNPESRARLGPVIGRSDKVHLAPPVVAHAVPLSALYILRRSRANSRLEIEALSPPDPRAILANSFVSYVQGRQQLLNQLDVCARIAIAARLSRVQVPQTMSAREAAAALEAHARSA